MDEGEEDFSDDEDIDEDMEDDMDDQDELGMTQLQIHTVDLDEAQPAGNESGASLASQSLAAAAAAAVAASQAAETASRR